MKTYLESDLVRILKTEYSDVVVRVLERHLKSNRLVFTVGSDLFKRHSDYFINKKIKELIEEDSKRWDYLYAIEPTCLDLETFKILKE